MTCNPIVFFVYKRPECARVVFDQIRKAKPPILIFVSDGPRNIEEASLVFESRSLCELVDWNCRVIRIFSEINLGCKKRFFTALDTVFDEFEQAIILEDDCVPHNDFFEFCDWGLQEFKDNNNVAIISGSNLHQTDKNLRNNFSRYMSCWGWATWSRTWRNINRYIGIRDLNQMRQQMLIAKFSRWEALFWSEVLKHTICSNSIWDFYVQHFMFQTHSLSVFPGSNLIKNIGFGDSATHTFGNIPEYVLNNTPELASTIMSFSPSLSIQPDYQRDRELAAKIWSCTPLMSIRLLITNAIRFIKA